MRLARNIHNQNNKYANVIQFTDVYGALKVVFSATLNCTLYNKLIEVD